VPPGTYRLDISGNGCGNNPPNAPFCLSINVGGITLETDKTQDLTIPTVILNVTVIDPLGNPVPNTFIQSSNITAESFELYPGLHVSQADIQTIIGRGITDSSGVAHLILLPASSVDLGVYPPAESGLSNVTVIAGNIYQDTGLVIIPGFIQPPNESPVADAGGSYTVDWGTTLTVDGSNSTDPDNNIASYEWDLDNDGQYDDASGVTATTSFHQIGVHIIELRVTDSGGLSDTDTATVKVLPWTLKGFYHPVDMNGIYNIVKGGSTVSFKFEVFVGSTELTDIANIRSFTYAPTSCDANAKTDEIETTVSGGTSLHYADGQFIYNWKTPKTTGCYRVTLTTIDGSSLVAYFKFK
jgi:hypothetical protein